ncbi:50S ribosomal protein L11 methyltransferase [Galbibacter mesophilus]|uniref:50S ribosomal protein L11 methyltransferase n=1 Tax=Galbibacter mesophilus TaxID=379069 RepID=UPI00191E500E|nr:50S ribosomal protein L11 methyltransferase [Galbibacter mesophilus]MCM5662815.1 50S ribosomal protein L11 methyltransferase [Galbibacter mesophilus]
MDQIYLEYQFKVEPLVPGNEILIAELGFAGFESFVENEDGLVAYIQKEEWHENILEDIHILSNPAFTISSEFKEIAQQNWNAEWEKNFHPIEVDGLCTVRAPFHEKPNTKYDIIIEPKMSFGTGHHETTHMMIQFLLKTDLNDKKVLDMGCGTGVLAILAEKEGASEIDAIDIDNWCYLNSVENTERNDCSNITVFEGDASLLKNKSYDVIIANINRNILLEDIPTYVNCLNKGGTLLLSGFYKDDIPQIQEKCEAFSLKFVENLEKNHWVAVKFLN